MAWYYLGLDVVLARFFRRNTARKPAQQAQAPRTQRTTPTSQARPVSQVSGLDAATQRGQVAVANQTGGTDDDDALRFLASPTVVTTQAAFNLGEPPGQAGDDVVLATSGNKADPVSTRKPGASDTKLDIKASGHKTEVDVPTAKQAGEEVVSDFSGRKHRVGSHKQVIDKTPADTSGGAAAIIKRYQQSRREEREREKGKSK